MATTYSVKNLEPVGNKIENIYSQRLKQFTNSREYKDTSILTVLEKEHANSLENIKLGVYHVPDLKRPLFKSVMKDAKFEPAKIGDKFGPSWSTHWFKVEIKVPAAWSDEPVVFKWDCGNEGLIFTESGEVVVGLTTENRQEWFLPKELKNNKWHCFYIETSCNALFGNASQSEFGIEPPIPDKYYTLEIAELVVPNLKARALMRDFEVLSQCVESNPENSWQRKRAIEVASNIMDAFDNNDDSSIDVCRNIAKGVIGDITAMNDGADAQVHAIGHCHIDTAWLWPYAETRRKIGRSWASQLDLIERYPEYNFVCSQAVQYQWLLEDYPDVFSRLKKAAEMGRFMPIGGSWVESDTNLPSGEAIARQFLYGQRFFEAHFGKRCKTFWLPDTFGYSAQIPQLCREAGLDRFVTIKLSWNNINKFPHSTFNWVALDGSQVLCHMPPDDNYNSNCKIGEIISTVSNNKSSAVTEKSLYLYGIGDGGGGPTEQMLENLRRCKAVKNTFSNVPSIKLNSNVDTYFDEIINETNGGKRLSTWHGELYFEYHRGTYTTEALMKYNNRKSEILMHDLELLGTVSSLTSSKYKYPKTSFDWMWKDILLNQFHDVLPGSAIEMVYDDAAVIYNKVYEEGKVLFDAMSDKSCETIFLNTLDWQRASLVEVSKDDKRTLHAIDSQPSYQDDKVILPIASSINNSIMEPISVEPENFVFAKKISPDTVTLENKTIRATIKHGVIVSLIDLMVDREIIAIDSTANQFVIYEDKPLFWQGWDTEVYSLNTKRPVANGTTTIIESGPLRASVLVEQKISDKSWLKTIISLGCVMNSEYPTPLEFQVEVEWNESSKFLKVEFPVDIYDTEATYDSMYGAVRRPTHFNTTWDMAKFEVCCHKYADYSELDYGVTVINEAKYGFATHGNVMRLSLLRSSKAPDGNADMGHHKIRYALQPHSGRLDGRIVRRAWNFNHELISAKLPISLKKVLPLISFEGADNVIMSAIKRGEDDADASSGDLPIKGDLSKSVIVRLFDSLGGKSKGKLISKLPIARAYLVNLLEDIQEEIEVKTVSGQSIIPVSIGRFQIASVKLILK